MEILKYLFNKKIYILINIMILGIGYYFINKGVSLSSSSYTATSSNVYISIGASLIAAGIVVFLDLWKNFSISKIFERIQNIINEGGIKQLFNKRDIDRYDDLVNNLTKSIDICGYSLTGFFDSFSNKLKEKFQQNPKIKIRVIFVDCDSEASKTREKIEEKALGTLKSRFETFKNFFNSFDNNVEIRLIDFPLSSMIFRIDDVLFVGPHFYKKQSKATLTMEIERNKWMYDEYQKEFDRMWDDAKPIK